MRKGGFRALLTSVDACLALRADRLSQAVLFHLWGQERTLSETQHSLNVPSKNSQSLLNVSSTSDQLFLNKISTHQYFLNVISRQSQLAFSQYILNELSISSQPQCFINI